MDLVAKWLLYLGALRSRYSISENAPGEAAYLADQYRRAQGALRRLVEDETARGTIIPARVEEALRTNVDGILLSGRAA